MKMKLVGILVALIILGATSITKGGTVWIEPWDLSINGSAFYFEHGEGWSERFVPDEDIEPPPPPPGSFISISSRPYPGNTSVEIDRRNQESTLPIDIIVELTGQSSADPNLYVQITDQTGYEHRNLTIQEIDPCNPDNPLNPNPEYDIRDRQNNHGGHVPGSSPLEEGQPRYWRVRCYTKLPGDIYEDGQVDVNDVNSLTDEWLYTTYDSNGVYVGNNYAISDRNHDGFSNFIDFAIVSEDWLKEE